MELTLKMIRVEYPCYDGWKKLLRHLKKTTADDEPLSLLTVFESNGLDDTLLVMDITKCNLRLSRHFGAWCAERVLHLFEQKYPEDMRPRQAIAMAQDDTASDEGLSAARDAALAAALAAAKDEARSAAWAAALAAALAAAKDEARAAALAAAKAAPNADEARAAQSDMLRKMLEAENG